MRLTYTIEKAIKKASLLHDGQVRKGTPNFPYITHLFSVATILSQYSDDEEVIAAGILHDTIEDTNYSPEELKNEFGTRVHDMVMEVTEKKGKEEVSWRERKQAYLDSLAHTDNAEALLISVADKMHNLRSIIDDLREHGDGILKALSTSPSEQLWFFGEHMRIVKERLNSPIIEEYQKVFDEAAQIFKSNA